MIEVLPDLGLAVAAGFLLLIAAALWVLDRVITGALGHLPLVGGWVSRDLSGWLNDARNAVLKGAASSWGGAVSLFNWASDFLFTTLLRLVLFAGQVAATIDHIATVQIPDAISSAESGIAKAVSAAEADARTLFGEAEKYADAAVTVAEKDARDLLAAAVTSLDHAVTVVETDARDWVAAAVTTAANELTRESSLLTADIGQAEKVAAQDLGQLAASVDAGLGQLTRDLATGVATAEAVAKAGTAAAAQAIYTDLETIGNQAVAHAWPDASQDVAGLGGILGADFPWLKDLLPALAGAGAVGLLGALTRALAGAQVATRLAEDCTIPNCRNLSQFGQDLQELLGDAGEAALLAWIIFLVTDPGGWANDMTQVAVPVAAAATHTAATLFKAA
jgi:hypothetical protein